MESTLSLLIQEVLKFKTIHLSIYLIKNYKTLATTFSNKLATYIKFPFSRTLFDVTITEGL